MTTPVPAKAASRTKDLANIEGVRQNQLIGYGLEVGLNGTGDTLNNIPFTKQSLQAMLERLGVNIRGAAIRTGNVAAVMVTGNLPPFGTQGTRMDVTVSALGDSKSLQGGRSPATLAPPRRRCRRRRAAVPTGCRGHASPPLPRIGAKLSSCAAPLHLSRVRERSDFARSRVKSG